MTAAPVEAKQKLAFDFDHATLSSLEPVVDPRALDNGLTRDNLHLSEPKISENLISRPFAGDCKNAFDGLVAEYVRASVSKNTQSAYRSDLKQFEIWGGQIPATPQMIAHYLAVHAESLCVATLVRRLAAITKAHAARGLPSPTTTEIVKATTLERRRRPIQRRYLELRWVREPAKTDRVCARRVHTIFMPTSSSA